MSDNKVEETREYRGEINDFLVESKYFDIAIDPKSNINKSLIEGMNKKLSDESRIKLDLENTIISKSKNYVPENDKSRNHYEWHSWNALTKKQVDKNKSYYLFAVKYESNEEKVIYKCMLFENKKLKEFLENITMTANEQYFFYFAHKM